MTQLLTRISILNTSSVAGFLFRVRSRHTVLTLVASLALITPVSADDELIELSLEELMEIQVTSVAKKPQSLSQTAAAAFVITREDIRRSGVIAVPDLLRMVPGMNVARIDANKWAVSARGFNDQFSNKLLVMVDGRSVYTPFFSRCLLGRAEYLVGGH